MSQPGWDYPREYGPFPKKDKHGLKKWQLALILGGLLLFVVIAFGGHGGTTGSSQGPTSDTTTITYTVTGDSAGMIDYTTDGGASQEQQSDVKLPFTKTINVPSGGLVVASIMAQSNGTGPITCEITDSAGNVLKKATSAGEFAVVTCAGRLS